MISVVVPLFNYARYIEDNIQSILAQSMSDWELIIVDDCSKDNPYPVIKPYLNDKVKYVRLDHNEGYGAAKNVGIKESRGEYIVVLDADDMLTKKSLKIRLNRMEKKQRLWCHGKAYEFSGSPPYEYRYHIRKFMKRFLAMQKSGDYRMLWKNIHAQTVMIHRSIYEKVGLYEPKLRSMGDKEMWARICNNVEDPLYVDEFVAYYRMHPKQMHRSKHKIKNLQKYESIMNDCIRKRKRSLQGVIAL